MLSGFFFFPGPVSSDTLTTTIHFDLVEKMFWVWQRGSAILLAILPAIRRMKQEVCV